MLTWLRRKAGIFLLLWSVAMLPMSATVQAEQGQDDSLAWQIKRLKVTEAKLAWELQEMKGVASTQQTSASAADPVKRQNGPERERMMMRSIIESQGTTEGLREIDIPLAHSQQEAVPLTQKIVELERVKAALAKLEEIKQLENLEAKLAWELRDMKGVPSAQQMAAGEADPARDVIIKQFMEQQTARKRERMIMHRSAIDSLNNAERETGAVNISSLTQQIVELEHIKAAVAQVKHQEAISDDVTLMAVAQPAEEGSGAISGKMTDAAGTGIVGSVVAYDASSGSSVASGSAGSDGSYTIGGLPTGSYKVQFYPQDHQKYVGEWYNNKSRLDTADVVSVTAPDTTANINAVLAEGGSISGKMTDAAGTGIAGSVVAYDASSGSWVTGSSTGSDGSYTIGGLPTGSYKVYFFSSSFGGSYISEWYNDKSSIDTADAVSVTAPNTTANINAVLAESGSISGKMTDAAGTGIAGSVVAYDASSGSWVTGSSTGSDGSYTIGGLPTGSYKVRFYPDGSYISEWYNDKSSIDTADAVSVTAPNTTANINAVLAEGGSISGKMTDAAGTGIAGSVYAYDASSSGSWAGSSAAGSDGSYTVSGLPTGSYKVYFYPQDHQKYVGEWYNNKSSFDTADVVSVTAPNTTANINATLDLTGSISGKVTDAKGTGVAGGYVYAYGVSSYSYYSSFAQTQQDGSYIINGLPAGRYKVSFSPADNDYVIGEWYNNGPSFNCSDWVTVTSAKTTANINAVLAEAGSISGKMTDAAGAGVTGYVYAYDASSGSWVASGYQGSDGSYTIGGLPAGSYKVEFSPSGNYLSEWYNDKSSIDTADAVSVTVLKTTANINPVLAEGGSISGKMTNAAGAGLAGYVLVQAAQAASSDYYAGGYSYTSDGNYTIGGLPTGSYKVHFYPSDSYVGEWYSDKSSFDTAAAVSVTAPNTTANINAVLAEGGSISGKITDAAGAEVSGLVDVVVYDLDGSVVGYAYSSADGSYKVDGLWTGSYKIRFSDYAGRYASEWHNDKNSFAAAEAVVVTAPNTTPNINAVLAQGGSIKGKMTTPDGAGIYDGYVSVFTSDDKTMEAGYSRTDREGGYVISGLKTGTYKVQFNPNSNSCSDGKPYAEEWYNNKGSFSFADRVQVTSPNTTSNINAAVDTFKGGTVIPIIINMLLH